MLASWVAHQRMLGLSVEKVLDQRPGELRPRDQRGLGALAGKPGGRTDGTPADATLKAQVKEARAVGADETLFRINGENGWLWVYTHLSAMVYQLALT